MSKNDQRGRSLDRRTGPLSRLWYIAMALACEGGRWHLDVTDVRAAELVLLSGKAGARRPIGFVQSRLKGQEDRE